MSIDAFYNRKYNSNTYNCAHFVCEVWQHLTGRAIASKLGALLLPVASRHASFALRRDFERLATPCSPCIVLMMRPRFPSHVGIYLNGRIFHIRETGVELQPLDVASFGFKFLRYYKC